MKVSLKYVKVLMDFLSSSGQGLEVVNDLLIVSPKEWHFSYTDLDGKIYDCVISEKEADLSDLSVIFSSDIYNLVIALGKEGS